MTPNEHNIFGQLCLGIVDPDVRARIHRVMAHGEKRHGFRPLQSADAQLTKARKHLTFPDMRDIDSGLPNRDHALTRAMLAMVKMIQEIGNESSEKNR
jgi:hypothetical protein